MKTLYGGIEAGGTKWICAIGTGPDDIWARQRIATTSPERTLGAVAGFFRQQQEKHGPLTALGVASFGPVDLRMGSPTWGHITTTPKPGWAQTDVAGRLSRELDVAVAFDTDVNGAALGELRWGAGQDLRSLVYLTVGTGIGGGAVLDGEPVHGWLHPEMGHVRLPRHPDDDFAGVCRFHGDCLEGMASGPAIAQRWGRPAEELPPSHPAWEIEAFYLGTAAANLTLTLSPERIVFGGGVSKAPGLLDKTRKRWTEALAGYIQAPDEGFHAEIYAETFIVAPELGDDAGICGAFELARRIGS